MSIFEYLTEKGLCFKITRNVKFFFNDGGRKRRRLRAQVERLQLRHDELLRHAEEDRAGYLKSARKSCFKRSSMKDVYQIHSGDLELLNKTYPT